MASTPNNGRRLPAPYSRHGHSSTAFTPSAIARVPVVDSKGIASVAEWTLAGSLAAILGGADELTRPLEENETLWACATVKSAAVRQVPLKIYLTDDPAEDDEISDYSDPVAALFRSRPNGHQSFADLMARHVFHRIDGGEDRWFLADAQGNPVEVDPASQTIATPSQFIQLKASQVELDKCDQWGFPAAWKYPAASGAKQPPPFPALAVLSFIDVDPYTPFRGLGAADVARRWLDAQFQAQRYIEGLTHNSGQPGGVLTVPKGAGKDEIQRIEAGMDDRVSDPTQRGRFLVVEGGLAFTPNQLAPKDMEFGTLLEKVVQVCCKTTGVPPPCIGLFTDATYNNIKTAERIMWTGGNGVIALLHSVEAVLNERFFPRLRDKRYQTWRAYFDLSDIEALREDNSARVEACARTAVSMSAPYDDVAPLFGLDPQDKPWSTVPPAGASFNDAQNVGTDGAVPTDPAAPAADGALAGSGVQQTLLNGAQMQTATGIVESVAAGTMPRDSGIALLVTLLALTTEQANAVMGSAGTGTPTNPNPNSADAPSSPADSGGAPTSTDTAPASGKSANVTLKRSGKGAPIQERSARVEAWAAIEKRVGAPSEAVLMKPAKKFLDKYLDAQLARLRAYARNGKGTDSPIAKAFADDERALRSEPGFVQRIDAVLARIKADSGTAVDPELARQSEALLLNKAEWEAKMRTLFAAPLKRVASLALTDAAQEIDSISIGVGHPAVAEALSKQTITLAQDVTGTLAERVRTRILESLSKATSTSDLHEAIKEVLPELEGSLKTAFANRDARAQVIARTEGAKASNNARFEQFKEDGIAETQWLTEHDESVRDSHRAVDGTVAKVGEPFGNGLKYPGEDGAPPEETVNCFLPGTLVQGRFECASKAYYSGSARQIETARGKRLRVTPNHPVLTSRGWIAARDLNEGDDLLCHVGEVDVAQFDVLDDEQHKHVPARIEDVFETFAANGRVGASMVGALDFHGDAVGFASQVNAELADGELGREAVELREKLALVSSSPSNRSAASSGSLDEDLRSVALSAPGSPSIRELSFDKRPIVLLAEPLHPLSFGAAARLNALFSKDSMQRAAANSNGRSESLEGFAGEVTSDKVVRVSEFDFVGHVYDLQSMTGWIVANGIVSSNCRCRAQPVFED